MEIPSFEQLYAQHNARIWGLVFTMLRRAGTPDRALVDDLTQDVWLKVFLHPPQRADNLLSWLGIIAKFTVLDALRRKQVIARHRTQETLSELEFCLCDERSLDESLLRTEAVEAAWRQLNPMHQQVLALIADGRSADEMCEATGCSYETMKARLWRARQAFKRAYAS